VTTTTTQVLPIPRARDFRIRLYRIGHNANPDYFGGGPEERGIQAHYDTRTEAGDSEPAGRVGCCA
jgi:hypothetical protein